MRGAFHEAERNGSELGSGRPPPTLGIACRLLHHPRRPALRCPVQLVQELLFAREVAVDRPLGDARLLGDLRGRRVVVAARGKQLERRSDQALPRQIRRSGPRW